jgi:preprotein translocase subunit SecA
MVKEKKEDGTTSSFHYKNHNPKDTTEEALDRIKAYWIESGLERLDEDGNEVPEFAEALKRWTHCEWCDRDRKIEEMCRRATEHQEEERKKKAEAKLREEEERREYDRISRIPKPHTCELCNITLECPDSVWREHLESVGHRRRQHHCPECKIFCENNSKLEAHRMTLKHRTNTGELKDEKYCDVCKVRCRSQTEWDNHTETTKHRKATGEIETGYHCEPCGFHSKTKSSFADHCRTKKHEKNTAV